MHFDSAGQAEILRSSQKDQFYISQLRSKLADVFQSWAGNARLYIIILLQFIYLHVLFNRQHIQGN